MSVLFSVFSYVWQEFPAVNALELLVRANITVKSSIKHLVLKDAAAEVLARMHARTHTHTTMMII